MTTTSGAEGLCVISLMYMAEDYQMIRTVVFLQNLSTIDDVTKCRGIPVALYFLRRCIIVWHFLIPCVPTCMSSMSDNDDDDDDDRPFNGTVTFSGYEYSYSSGVRMFSAFRSSPRPGWLPLMSTTTTTVLRRFFRVSRCQKRTSGLCGARED